MAPNASSSLEDDDDVLGQYPSASSPLSIDELMKERAVQAAPPESWSGGFPPSRTPLRTPTARASAISAAGAPVDQSSPITPSPAPDPNAAPDAGGQPASFPAAEQPAPPAGPNEAAMRDMAASGLTQLNTNLTGATEAAAETPTTDADVTALDKQIAGTSVPTQLRERLPGDTTPEGEGKMLPQFAPSLGRRIWRGVRSGLVGLAAGGIHGGLIGALEPQDVRGGEAYGAPNTTYQRAEQGREQELSTLEDQRKSAFDAWKQSVDAAKEKAGQYRANATLGKDLTTGATDAIKADNDTPEAKARTKALEDTDSYNSRFTQLDALEKRVGKMPPASEAYFIANGKMPDPKEPKEGRQPSFEEIALQGLLSRLGHKPTHDEYLAAVQQVRGSGGNSGAEGRFDKGKEIEVQKTKDTALDKARTAAAARYWTAPAKADYVRAAQAAQDDYEAQMRTLGQSPQHMVVNEKTLAFEPAAGGAAPPAAAPAAAQPQAAPKLDDVRTYQGHSYKFDGQQWKLQPKAQGR